MARISKRIIAVVLMVAMLTTLLSGCSNNQKQKEVSPVPDNTQQVTPTENVTDVVTPTAAVIETGYKVYGHDADLIISEDWHDYIGRLDVFVYGLISEDFGIDFDVFPAGIVLPDGREVCGIAYTDYIECYTDETETKNYVATGFISAIGEDGITQEEMDSGLIIDDLENPDCSFELLYEYRSAPYKDHCVVYGQYLTYGVDENGCIFYENEPYQKEKCDESLGALYSYDEGRYLFNPNVGEFVPLTGETLSEVIDYAELEKEINEILETQDVNFAQVDVDSCFSIAQEAVAAYLLSLQEETFLGYDVASLVEIAKDLDSKECLRITEDGVIVVKVEEWIREPSAMMKWIVGTSTVVVGLVSIILTGPAKNCPLISAGLGAIAGVAIDIFMQVIVENKDIRDLDWRSVAVAAVEGAIAGAIHPGLTSREGLTFRAVETIIDGIIGGADAVIQARFDGKDWKESGQDFKRGFLWALALSATINIVVAGISRIPLRATKTELKKISKEGKKGFRSWASHKLQAIEETFNKSCFYSEKIANRRIDGQLIKSINALPKGTIFDETGASISKKQLRVLAKGKPNESVIGSILVDGETRPLVKINNTVTPDFIEDAVAIVKIGKITVNRADNFMDAAEQLLDDVRNGKTKLPNDVLQQMSNIDISVEDVSPTKFIEIIKACGYVFHESADLKVIMMIPASIHKKFRHAGGVSVAKAFEMAMAKTEFSSLASAAIIVDGLN